MRHYNMHESTKRNISVEIAADRNGIIGPDIEYGKNMTENVGCESVRTASPLVVWI